MDSKQDLILVETDPEVRKKFYNALARKTSSNLGICEQLRFIYDDVYGMPEGELKHRLTERLVDALIMGKKMNDRLVWYRKKYDKDNTGHSGVNLLPLQNNHWRIRMRWARPII